MSDETTLTDEEMAKLKFVRLHESFNSLQVAHNHVMGDLGRANATVNNPRLKHGGL